MLNEERIILMTKMASYEENEGKKNVSIGSYFRGDYIGLQVIKSVLNATIAYFLILGMVVLYHFETFMQDIYKIDILSTGKNLILSYLSVVISYALVSYAIYAYRYQRAKKSLKNYYNHLKKLSYMYDAENKK